MGVTRWRSAQLHAGVNMKNTDSKCLNYLFYYLFTVRINAQNKL